MDQDRVEGTVRGVGGKLQEGAGRVAGDAGTEAKGRANQAAGAAQESYGKAKDAVRDTSASLDNWLRDTIEAQPYTATLVAIGIGWLLGRMHQPL